MSEKSVWLVRKLGNEEEKELKRSFRNLLIFRV